MTNTIMVGVDGRPTHRGALDWAATRAARDGSRLELVYVIERSWGDDSEEPGQLLALAAESLLTAEREEAERVVAASAERSTVDIATRYVYGKAGSELASASRDADLLVVGSRSRIEGERSFSGSLAVRVAATALCPVAVIPHDRDRGGSGVVAGVDGEPSSELAVAFAADEADALAETLTIVCAGYTANPLLAGLVPEISLGDRRQRIVEDAARLARELHPDLDVRTIVAETAPARGLVDAAEGSSLLVVGTHNRRGVKRLMLGSVSHDVLLNVRSPVVIARSRRDGTASDEDTP